MCRHHDILKDYLASKVTPTMTGAEYFPNFMGLHAVATALHPTPAANPEMA